MRESNLSDEQIRTFVEVMLKKHLRPAAVENKHPCCRVDFIGVPQLGEIICTVTSPVIIDIFKHYLELTEKENEVIT